MILVDSDHLSILLDPREARRPRLLERLQAATEVCAIPIIVVEEQLRAWLAQIGRAHEVHRQIVPYLRLGNLIES